MKGKLKRVLFFIITFIVMAIYFLATDPDLGLITDLPFGAELMLMLQVGVLTFAGAGIIEFLMALFLDDNGRSGNEGYLVEKASEDPKASGMIYIGNSIRILAYAVIFMEALSTVK